MTFEEALLWLLRAYAAAWFALVVVQAMADREAWLVPARDPVRERREHEERERGRDA